MGIAHLDHLVLTVADTGRTVAFYEAAVGMRKTEFGAGRIALRFGTQKFNLHQSGAELLPHARRPTPGSADFCLVAEDNLEQVIARLKENGIALEEGPVTRTGSTGQITSVYIRDPDENLVEICTYDRGRPHAPDPYHLLPPVPWLAVHSFDIEEGHRLADTFIYAGGNVSPQLAWEGAPEGARSIALTCYDPDAPTGSGFFHWFVVGIEPGHTEIGRGGDIDGSAVLRNDFGNARYDGAAPPSGDGPHRYIFAVHALDATADDLSLRTAPSLAAAGFAMTQHTIGRGTLTVTCEQP